MHMRACHYNSIIGGPAPLYSLSVLVLYTKQSLHFILEVSSLGNLNVVNLYWRPLVLVWVLCSDSAYERKLAIQIGGLSAFNGPSVMILRFLVAICWFRVPLLL